MVPQRQNVSLLLGEVFATFGEGFAKQKCIKFTKQLCLHMQLLKSKNSMDCTTVGFAKTKCHCYHKCSPKVESRKVR